MFSIRDDVSLHDSGIKEENRELKLNIAKLPSELHAMVQTIENQKAIIKKKEEDLQTVSQTVEDQKATIEEQLSHSKVKNIERMRKVEEEYTVDMRRNAVEMRDMKEAAAAFERMNDQLKVELKERELQIQAKDIASTIICESLQETFNEDLSQCLKNKENLEGELALSRAQVINQELKLTESANLLKESKAQREMYLEKVWKLALQ